MYTGLYFDQYFKNTEKILYSGFTYSSSFSLLKFCGYFKFWV